MLASAEKPYGRMLQRFGIAGFLFFLVKGLLWLLVPIAAAWLF